MLSAQAYSFRSKSRLAVSLSWLAGYTNVVMLVAAGQTVSHQTGNTTHLGRGLGEALLGRSSAARDAAYFGLLIGAFLCGAILSGLMTESARRIGHRSRYVLPLTVEGILLAVVLLLLLGHTPLPSGGGRLWFATALAALAMGLQNATITRISGSVVRTTHLSGVVTDLGLELVQLSIWYRGGVGRRGHRRHRRLWRAGRRHPTVQRVLLLGAVFGSFLLGATAGTVLFNLWGTAALLVPVLFLCGLVLLESLAPVADVCELDPATDLPPSLRSAVPDAVGLFRLVPPRRRSGRGAHHRAPDLAGWAARLPRRWRVVILLVGPLTRFDVDTAAGLVTAAEVLRGQGRTLIVTGVNRPQFKTLVQAGVTRLVPLANFVPDVEFAIARAISLSDHP